MEPNGTSQSESKKGLGIGIAIAAILAVIAAVVFGSKKDPSTSSGQAQPDTTTLPPAQPETKPTTTPSTSGTTTPSTQSTYKDGTYTATGSYMSPGGMDQVGVTLTLKNDIVTDVSVSPMAGDNTSERYQAMFVAGYKQYVVGKDIDKVKLDKVSGASLTPIGFNEAITKIEAQARV